MRVVISALGGGLGHLARGSCLAAELRSRGHEVELRVSPHTLRVAEGAGIAATPCTGDWPEVSADWTIIDASPCGYRGGPPPESWGRCALLARYQSGRRPGFEQFTAWSSRYEVAFAWEPVGYRLECPVVAVDPIVYPPLGGPRINSVLISLSTPDSTRRWERLAARACRELGLPYRVARGGGFPSGRSFGLYRAVVTHAGCNSFYELQQSGTPGVVIPQTISADDQPARAETVRARELKQRIREAWRSAPGPHRQLSGAAQVAEYFD